MPSPPPRFPAGARRARRRQWVSAYSRGSRRRQRGARESHSIGRSSGRLKPASPSPVGRPALVVLDRPHDSLRSTAPMSETPVPVLTPHRALRLELLPANSSALDDGAAGRLAAAFDRGSGHGLLQLGAAEAGSRLAPDLAFWRGFAVRFVAAVCAGGEPSTGGAPRVSQPTKDDLMPARRRSAADARRRISRRRVSRLALARARARARRRALESGLPIQAFLAKPGQPLAACRAGPFQPRRKPQGRRPPVRLPGDLRLDARGAGRPAPPGPLGACPARIRRRRRESRTPEAPRAGQPRERELQPG